MPHHEVPVLQEVAQEDRETLENAGTREISWRQAGHSARLRCPLRNGRSREIQGMLWPLELQVDQAFTERFLWVQGTMKRNFESVTQALEHYMKKYECPSRDELLKKFEDFNQSSQIKKPKYVFLNTLSESKKSLLKQLKEDGFVTIEYEEQPEEDLEVESPNQEAMETDGQVVDADKARKEAILNAKMKRLKEFLLAMNDNEFLRDDHIRHLLIFSPKSSINMSYRLFKEGHLLQIDKVSHWFPVSVGQVILSNGQTFPVKLLGPNGAGPARKQPCY